jgi:hypothetical protein
MRKRVDLELNSGGSSTLGNFNGLKVFFIFLSAVTTTSILIAGTVTTDANEPTINSGDIALFSGNTQQDLIWTDRPNPGQTFLSGAEGGLLNSFSVKLGTVPGLATKTFFFRVGTVSGTSFTTLATSTGSFTVNPAAQDFLIFTFDSPVTLQPSTLYGVDFEMTGSTAHWSTGISRVARTNSSQYPDGSKYTKVDGDPVSVSLSGSHDLIFHVDIDIPAKGTFFVIQ